MANSNPERVNDDFADALGWAFAAEANQTHEVRQVQRESRTNGLPPYMITSSNPDIINLDGNGHTQDGDWVEDNHAQVVDYGNGQYDADDADDVDADVRDRVNSLFQNIESRFGRRNEVAIARAEREKVMVEERRKEAEKQVKEKEECSELEEEAKNRFDDAIAGLNICGLNI